MTRALAVLCLVCIEFVVGSQASSLTYNEQTAKILAMASAGAYVDSPSSCIGSTFQMIGTFKNSLYGNVVFGFMAYETRLNALVLSFRGTDNAGQLVDELLHAAPKPFPGVPGVAVAGYFYDAFVQLSNGFYTVYNKAQQLHPNATLYITGHSLGGAIASVASIHLLKNHPRAAPTYLYSFGAPRAGNYTLSRVVYNMMPHAVRIVNGKDIVAHMPPCSSAPNKGCATTHGMIWWSFHHGSEIWYKNGMPVWNTAASGTYQQCMATPLGEDTSCSNSLSPWFGVDDHLHYYGLHVGTHCLKREIKQAFMQQEQSKMLTASDLTAVNDAFEARWESLQQAETARQQQEVDRVIAEWQEEMRTKHDSAVLQSEQPDYFGASF